MARPFLFVAIFLLACAVPRPAVNCFCFSAPLEKQTIEGDFLVTVDAITVESGDYVPPELPSVAAPTTLTITEDWITGTYGASTIWVPVFAHLQLVQTPGSSGGCCGSDWDGLSLDDAPRPWNERNAVNGTWSYDSGDVLADIDPGMEAFAAIPPLDTTLSYRSYTPDPDGLGFVTQAWFDVRPRGCRTDDCVSLVLVDRHFRRPE